jgi:hypothetical protein
MQTLGRARRRSVAFLERDGVTWACFLVSFQGEDVRWHGYFSFRPADAEAGDDEVRTADIFLERSEEEINRKARQLGRPLLAGLLSSALHTREKTRSASECLRRRFRKMLSENSRSLAGDWTDHPATDVPCEAELRSLYASYRLDQVAHLIALIRPENFEDTVDRILAGKSVDFGAKDRLQFSMMVVEHLEALLPLPPFEDWVADFLANRNEYRLYAHTLHRQGRLP